MGDRAKRSPVGIPEAGRIPAQASGRERMMQDTRSVALRQFDNQQE
jgi:hypothetical protein